MSYRIAVLASGRGSNLQALIDAVAAGRLPVEIVGAFSDRPDAVALERARDAGIPTDALRPRDFANRLLFDEQLFSRIDAIQPDLIVCAGYMRLISEREVDARRGRMINIHPSLLPAFKGLRTHEQALALLNTGQMYPDERLNQVDMRFAKIIRFSGRRADIAIDLYNIFNTNHTTGFDGSYDYSANNTLRGGEWLNPTSIVAPRFARVNFTLYY
jgi:hypothetical protein